MVNVPSDLGERIILATRMAVTAHWQQVLNQPLHEIHHRQQLSCSGTAAESVTDDLLPTATFGGGVLAAPPVPPCLTFSTESKMIYGLYLSASGIIANSYRQDVISNNLANAETTGFKRDLATFYQRPTEAQSRGATPGDTDDIMEQLGGGLFAAPTRVDSSQGDFESTGNNLDVAIKGQGFFTVSDGKNAPKLTRDGRFATDSEGNLSLASSRDQCILDVAGKAIKVDPTQPVVIGQDGTIMQSNKPIGRIGVFDVKDPSQLTKVGNQMLAVADPKSIVPSSATVNSQFLERSNVDPTTELTQLMDVQRQLEANANMIRYQDQMLDKLVNTVGKIG